MEIRSLMGRVFLMLVMVLSLSFVTSCKDSNEDPSPDPNEVESGAVDAIDDLEWFSDNLVLTDQEGNLTQYIRGRVLDPATPQTLFIGVDTETEAAQIFKKWLSPDSESRLMVAQDGSLIYSPTDKKGNSQGEIYYKKCDTEEDAIAIVTFSKEAALKYVKEVKFILNDLWPENADIRSPYALGEIVDFNTAYEYAGTIVDKFHGWQKAVCIREASKDETGLLVHLCNEKFPGGSAYPIAPYFLGPRRNMAYTIVEIFKRNWDLLASAYESAGTPITDDYYWIAETIPTPLIEWQYAFQLKNPFHGRNFPLEVYEGKGLEPRPLIMFRTFNATSE